VPAPAEEFPPPPVALANVYEGEANLSEYWVSEKLDGVRGYWDGAHLLTRGGHRIHAPDWFTADWPAVALDGELWLGRGKFAETSGIVRRQTPDDADWRRMRFMVFDLPGHDGSFDERLAALRTLLADLDVAWVRPVEQFRVSGPAELRARLKAVVAEGGEGLMLHRGDSHHRAGRGDDLLKVKLYRDAEARVVGHLPGKGKYEGMLGALVVERPDGLRFRLGTGFTDAQRRNPPPLGGWVTYRFNGFTKNGVPRFARFLRIRPGGDIE
jgi:DNA ligase-1